ncbi:MAG: NAD(P)/FAD-dependent oxidoreductase [Planctomycetaceae bacterium]|nr:NAD(P)/FAD-dependent oxidoreductase [Planctomycetaceae bacterium]
MTYDGIILGTGHNSLVLQAYAGRAGLKTISIDRSEVVGGGLSTVEHPAGSGFRHNIHSFFHRGLTQLPWYRDLELARHGASYMQPDLNVAMLCRDGRSLQWWNDFDKTIASVASFSERDATTLQRWRDAFRPIVRNILIPESHSPPLPPAERQRKLEQSADGRLLLDTSRLSPLEFVQREFEDPAVQAGMLFFNGLREVDLRQPGFGHHIPALLASDAMAQMCVGGSKQLAIALTQAIRESGGEMRLGTSLQRIVVENGRAVAIETADGERIEAKHFIASGLNPQQTFLDLIDPEHLPAEWRAKVRDFQYNLLAPLFGLNLNLREAPRYKDAAANEALMVILGLDHVDQFSNIVAHHEAGTIPPTVMWGACPTQFDATQAPANCHTAFMWEKLPYALHGNPDNWDAVKEQHGAEMLQLWSQFAPNVIKATIESFTRSPLDTERMLPNMRGGDLLVGAFANDQVGYHRPFPGAGHYRGHLPGLYLCGSCCHPGGNITGLPGYNCSQVLLNDLGIATRWMPQESGNH